MSIQRELDKALSSLDGVPLFERLEARVLLSVTAEVDDTGVLTIEGTDKRDVIMVDAGEADGQVIVRAQGINADGEGDPDELLFEGVNAIVVNANRGNDKVVIGDGLTDSLGEAIGASVDGGDGNDVLIGGDHEDTLIGGKGNDRIFGNGGDDEIDTGDGVNLARGGDGNDTIAGGRKNDRLYGGDGDDDIDAGDGNNNRVYGEGGNDTLVAGRGGDKVYGGDGDDDIDAGDGNNKVYGDDGDDSIVTGDGKDKVRGGDGNDTVEAGDGKDHVWGGDGDDSINGEDGNDHLNGGPGADTVIGGDGRDKIKSDGDDVVIDADDIVVTEVEPNNTTDQAAASPIALALGGEVELRGSVSDSDTDVFALNIDSAGFLEVEVETTNGQPVTVEILDTDGTTVLGTVVYDPELDDDAAEGVIEILAPGLYFIRVLATTPTPAKYEVELDLEDESGSDGDSDGESDGDA